MASADEEEECSRQLEQQHGSFVGELCPGSRDEHVTAMGRTEVCPTGGIDHFGADVLEVGWTDATDAVKCGSRNLELNPLGHRQAVENITQDWRNMVTSARTNNQAGCGVSTICSRRVTCADTL